MLRVPAGSIFRGSQAREAAGPTTSRTRTAHRLPRRPRKQERAPKRPLWIPPREMTSWWIPAFGQNDHCTEAVCCLPYSCRFIVT